MHGAQFASVRNVSNCIYLCELTNGLVKVGFSNSPRRRLTSLSRQWSGRGARISRFEVFVGTPASNACLRDPHGNEKRAIKALGVLAAPIDGHAEYFSGIPYDTALAAVSASIHHNHQHGI